MVAKHTPTHTHSVKESSFKKIDTNNRKKTSNFFFKSPITQKVRKKVRVNLQRIEETNKNIENDIRSGGNDDARQPGKLAEYWIK